MLQGGKRDGRHLQPDRLREGILGDALGAALLAAAQMQGRFAERCHRSADRVNPRKALEFSKDELCGQQVASVRVAGDIEETGERR